MKTSVNVRIIAALAATCTTFLILGSVASLAEVPQAAGAQRAKAPVAATLLAVTSRR